MEQINSIVDACRPVDTLPEYPKKIREVAAFYNERLAHLREQTAGIETRRAGIIEGALRGEAGSLDKVRELEGLKVDILAKLCALLADKKALAEPIADLKAKESKEGLAALMDYDDVCRQKLRNAGLAESMIDEAVRQDAKHIDLSGKLDFLRSRERVKVFTEAEESLLERLPDIVEEALTF